MNTELISEEDKQLILDLCCAVSNLLEKVEEFDDDVNHQSPFDIDDARLCYTEVKEVMTEIDKLLNLLELTEEELV